MKIATQMFIVGFMYAVAKKFDFVQDMTYILLLIMCVLAVSGQPKRK